MVGTRSTGQPNAAPGAPGGTAGPLQFTGRRSDRFGQRNVTFAEVANASRGEGSPGSENVNVAAVVPAGNTAVTAAPVRVEHAAAHPGSVEDGAGPSSTHPQVEAATERGYANVDHEPREPVRSGSTNEPETHLGSQHVRSDSMSDRAVPAQTETADVLAARVDLQNSNLNRDLPQNASPGVTVDMLRTILQETVRSFGPMMVNALEVRERQHPVCASRPLTQNPTQLSDGLTGHDGGIRIADVKLSEFAGNADSNASFVDPEYYLQLLSWIKDCSVVLRASGLSVRRQVLCMIGHLRGAARHAFMTEHQEADIGAWSLDTLIGALAALIPDHKTLFTRKAVEIRFSRSTLRDNIETFSLLVKHGEISQNSHFWFDQLQRKLLDAAPNILSDASGLYNLRLEWREGMSFADMITQTIEIVSRLQADGRLLKARVPNGQAGEAESNAASPRQGGARHKNGGKNGRNGNRALGVQGGGVSKPRGNKIRAKPMNPELRDLAVKYDRCFDCGQHCPKGTISQHKSHCPKDKALFATRLGRVRAFVKKGTTDYQKINNFGHQPSSGGNSGAGGSKPQA
jgi:hypothetical protein